MWIGQTEEFISITDASDRIPSRGSHCEDFAVALAKKNSYCNCVTDQSVIAGVGNVYRAEFFLLGIHPERPACDLKAVRLLTFGICRFPIASGSSVEPHRDRQSRRWWDHLGDLSPRTLCMCTSEKITVSRCSSPIRISHLLAGVAGGAIVAKADDAGKSPIYRGTGGVVNVSGTRDTRWLSGRQLFGIEDRTTFGRAA